MAKNDKNQRRTNSLITKLSNTVTVGYEFIGAPANSGFCAINSSYPGSPSFKTTIFLFN